jgi:hypothetical protein
MTKKHARLGATVQRVAPVGTLTCSLPTKRPTRMKKLAFGARQHPTCWSAAGAKPCSSRKSTCVPKMSDLMDWKSSLPITPRPRKENGRNGFLCWISRPGSIGFSPRPTMRSMDARVLSAMGARTIFDRASELLRIDSALTFKEKLDQLQNKGHISASERAQLDILTHAGSAAAHRGWKPTADQLNTVMSIVETFVHRKFVLESEAKRLKAQIPRRKKRRKKRP